MDLQRSASRTLKSCGALLFLFMLVACAPSLDNRISLDPGETETVHITAHCGFSTLELDVNEQTWSTNDLHGIAQATR